MLQNPTTLGLQHIALQEEETFPWHYEEANSVLAFFLRFVRKKAFYALAKRGVDLVLSSLLLILTSPIFLVVAILIKVTSSGPVFFRHNRLGKEGKEFGCLKFRTMVVDAEQQLKNNAHLRKQFESNYKIQSDPRVTRLGAFLRKTSIDELPQLFQILTGKMSLIGPRPIVKAELDKYGVYQYKLLSVKPGLSGLWQACGRSNTTYSERVHMDMFYIDHRCLLFDLLLMFLTVFAVMRKRGAY